MERIEQYLISKGYTITNASDTFVRVLDPIHCYSGSRKWIEYDSITIRNMRDAIRFVLERE